MVLLRLSIVAVASLIALTLVAWLASARPAVDHPPCGEGPGDQVCHAGLAVGDQVPRPAAL